jgi:acetyl-CoA acetyltransferase
MIASAASDALDEAGLTFADVDGLFVNGPTYMPAVEVAEYLGVRPHYLDSTSVGGCSYQAFVNHAVAAILTGRCEVALIAYASLQRSRKSRGGVAGLGPGSLINSLELATGIHLPIGYFALQASRHMHLFGTKPEQLAEIAVAARRWAALNPKASLQTPLTVEDVLASPYLSEPIHRLEACLVSDGSAAIVLTGRDRARDAKKRPVRVIGAAEGMSHWLISQVRELETTSGRDTAARAFGEAGITPRNIDFLEPYDAFTISVLLAIEDLGFCAKGEGGSLVEGGRLGPGGALPAMTSGGGLSYCHPGELGLLLLVEAVRQLRGEAGARQVPDAKIGVAHGIGGANATAATVVLARD